MRNLMLFMNVSLDGYVETLDKSIEPFHSDGDFEAYSPEQGQEVDTLLFGRKTYEMMRNFWPTPQAAEFAPEIAKFMNEKHKVVVSHQPYEPGWSNVTVISGDAIPQIRQLKNQPGHSIIMFGSNTLCVSLVEQGLIDEIQLMVNPILFGGGISLFEGLPSYARLSLADTRPFKSGKVLLTYKPATH